MKDSNSKQRIGQNVQTMIALSILTLLTLTFSSYTQNFIANYQLLFILSLPVVIIFTFQHFKLYILALYEHLNSEWDFLCSVATGIVGTLVQFYLINACYSKVPILYWAITAFCIALLEIYLVYLCTNKRNEILLVKLREKRVSEPIFLNDEPVDIEGDELGLGDDAISFAKSVENNKSTKSLVFGIDAPWGTGKTTYLRFCKKQWADDGCLIFEFSPLRYDRIDLIPLFLNSFGDFLLENKYPRGIRVLFKKYSKKIAQLPKMFNLDVTELLSDGPSDEDLLDALSNQLKITEKKIVVIIDDLDRLPVSQIKSFVDIVRVGLKVSNVSFVLCFDTKNIYSFEQPLIRSESTELDTDKQTITRQYLDNAKFADYLEKVVMIKQTLIVHPAKIKAYLQKYLFRSSVDEGKMFSEKSENEIQVAIEKFFDPDIFHLYVDQLGDLRKIKRLINVMRLRFGKLDVDINQLDFNGYDLTILMMIYLNFPDLFRKIYLTEIEGKEFFSLKYNPGHSRDNKSRYVNSEKYKKFKQTLSSIEQLLIDAIFSEKRFSRDKNPTIISGSDSAAFNGSLDSGRNLENYLKLIVETTLPVVTGEKKYYVKLLGDLRNEKTMSDISEMSSFTFSSTNNAESHFTLFIQALIRNIDVENLISKDVTVAVLKWFINNIEFFSEINIEKAGIGLRDDLTLDALYLLDKRGWSDTDGRYYGNTPENVLEVANYILGTSQESGMLKTLLRSDRGILGVLDGVKLRLHCSPFRGGEFYNLRRGLEKRAEIKNIATSDEANNVMREITQVIFKEFNQRYIVPKISFMNEVLSLTDQDLYGKSYDYVTTNDLFDEKSVRARKIEIISFLSYQLINSWKTELDFGFGLFDENGLEDNGSIRKTVQEYLFSCCFAISDVDHDNTARMFLDYMFSQYEFTMNSRSSKYTPDISRVGKLLGEESLKKYWSTNRYIIKRASKNIIGTFEMYNRSLNYQDEVPKLLNALDEYLGPAEQPNAESEDL